MLEHLSTSRVRRVVILGRRGPLQASFMLRELRELHKLPRLLMEFTPIDIFDETLLSGSDRTKLLTG